LFNKQEFINWTVEGNRQVVVIPKLGEVLRGKAVAFQDDTLQIKIGDLIQEINVENISEIFSVRKK